MADFWQMVEFSHILMTRHIQSGATVIDATAGNGHDSLLLANLVGDGGRVYAFDIQEKALSNTEKLLAEHKVLHRVELIKDGHQNLNQYIKKEIDGMNLNLGYLPGGDKEVITNKESTIEALEKRAGAFEERWYNNTGCLYWTSWRERGTFRYSRVCSQS